MCWQTLSIGAEINLINAREELYHEIIVYASIGIKYYVQILSPNFVCRT